MPFKTAKAVANGPPTAAPSVRVEGVSDIFDEVGSGPESF
jgi:hypothetical protein